MFALPNLPSPQIIEPQHRHLMWAKQIEWVYKPSRMRHSFLTPMSLSMQLTRQLVSAPLRSASEGFAKLGTHPGPSVDAHAPFGSEDRMSRGQPRPTVVGYCSSSVTMQRNGTE